MVAKKNTPIDLLNQSQNNIIKTFAIHEGDNGSPEVQSALFTKKILQLSEHLKINKRDNHSRRGLLQLIGKRRRILQYLERKDKERYAVLIDKLGLKK
jgi:small subunit ribosomal protein S15